MFSIGEQSRPGPAMLFDKASFNPAIDCDFYSIATRAPDVMRITIQGFWDEHVMSDFVQHLGAALDAMPCPAGSHRVLCDVTGSALQTQSICQSFLRIRADSPAPARAIAFVNSNPASRMQARRLITGYDNIALFENEERAIEWLADVGMPDV